MHINLQNGISIKNACNLSEFWSSTQFLTSYLIPFLTVTHSVFEDSKMLSDIWSDSRLKVVGHTQKLSAMQAPQRTKKRHFILTPLDF